MYITGSLINSYFICPRKTWLFAHQLSPDPDWELLELGRLITEETYKRDKKELSGEGMKIDVLKREDGDIVVGEIKKSSKGLKAAKMQLLFYLYKLKKQGVNLKGEILIPKEKKKIKVELTPELESELKKTFTSIREIILQDKPPEPVKTKFCNHCAYKEFCWER